MLCISRDMHNKNANAWLRVSTPFWMLGCAQRTGPIGMLFRTRTRILLSGRHVHPLPHSALPRPFPPPRARPMRMPRPSPYRTAPISGRAVPPSHASTLSTGASSSTSPSRPWQAPCHHHPITTKRRPLSVRTSSLAAGRRHHGRKGGLHTLSR